MNLYAIHDDGCGCCLTWEERTSEDVWAATESEARAVYRERWCRASGNPSCDLPEQEINVALREVPPGVLPAKDGPHAEDRPEVLRLLGWAIEDEGRCYVCELAPMGMPENRLCDECDRCPRCCRCNPEEY